MEDKSNLEFKIGKKVRALRNEKGFNQEYVAVQDIKYIENVPKIIIQGKNDKIVPAIRGKNLYNSAKMPKIYWENNSEHIMTLINLPKETTERIKKQLE